MAEPSLHVGLSRHTLEAVRDAVEDYLLRHHGIVSRPMPDDEVKTIIEAATARRCPMCGVPYTDCDGGCSSCCDSPSDPA